jgi:hypothetical protein
MNINIYNNKKKYGSVLFLFIYFTDFVLNFLVRKESRFNYYKSYYNIQFEKEAREEEKR